MIPLPCSASSVSPLHPIPKPWRGCYLPTNTGHRPRLVNAQSRIAQTLVLRPALAGTAGQHLPRPVYRRQPGSPGAWFAGRHQGVSPAPGCRGHLYLAVEQTLARHLLEHHPLQWFAQAFLHASRPFLRAGCAPRGFTRDRVNFWVVNDRLDSPDHCQLTATLDGKTIWVGEVIPVTNGRTLVGETNKPESGQRLALHLVGRLR